MATKFIDLSQDFGPGATMWPRFAADAPCAVRNTFQGIRSTSWHNENHPGWWDMGWPFPFNQGASAAPWGHQHGGTHIDAPVYAIPDGITSDKIPLENLWGTGVVLDFRKKQKWEPITGDDLEKATPKVQAGDFVVINTAWQKRVPPGHATKRYYEYFNQYPGLVISAAEWLIKKKVKAIAGTWPTPDNSLSVMPLDKWAPWIVEQYKREMGKEPPKSDAVEPCLVMLLKAGVSCISNAGGDIDEVTGKRCTFFAWPYRLEDTDAAHVRLVAVVEG